MQVLLRPGPFEARGFHAAAAKLAAAVQHGPSEPAKTGTAVASRAIACPIKAILSQLDQHAACGRMVAEASSSDGSDVHAVEFEHAYLFCS